MRSLVLTSCLVALASCASSNPGNLKKTATVDLGCPAKQLTIDQLQKSKAGSTYLVTGCGKTAKYQVTKKNAVRTTEVTAYVAPPAPHLPAEPPPPQSAQQQADFNAFMQEHDARHAQGVADMQQSMDASANKPLPSQQQPPPPPAPAPAPASVRSSVSESGYVCLNGSYFACPTAESTAALGAYGQCKFKCAMGGRCSSCVVGAGEQCTRESSRDSSCN